MRVETVDGENFPFLTVDGYFLDRLTVDYKQRHSDHLNWPFL